MQFRNAHRALSSCSMVASALLAACSSSSHGSSSDASAGDSAVMQDGSSSDAPALSDGDSATKTPDANTCDGAICPMTKIEHIIVIIQENHTFDNYYGTYCTAAPFSNPTCTTGPACCEAAPANPPGADGGAVALGDGENGSWDPNHLQACELAEIDDGGMDKFASAADVPVGTACGGRENIAYVPAAADGGTSLIQTYLNYAANGAIADHYFQPVAGQSSSNDMYLASAKFEYLDNDYVPDSIGTQCTNYPVVPTLDLTDPTIGDLLNDAGVPWAYYGAGYAAAVAAAKTDAGCSAPDPSCPATEQIPSFWCVYDAADNPFAYYVSLRDNPLYARDYTQLAKDLSGGTLPSVAYVKAFEAFSEHPGYGHTISDGVTFVKNTVSAIEASPYASSTLIVLTWDEGGGYYDHIAPPAVNPADNQPYGTRLPTTFIGPFVKKNYVSHVVMEHSSIVKFVEYNWLHGKTGQLGNRDTNVNNIGSVLDPAATVSTVP